MALAVYSLLQVACIVFQLPYDEPLSYTVFYGSIVGYNVIKYGGLWLNFSKKTQKRPYLFLSGICLILTLYYLLQLPYSTIFCLGIGFVYSLLYSLPFYKSKSLREFAGLKIYIVAFTWLISSTLSAFVHYEVVWYLPTLIYTISIFIWILCLMIPFEIRDTDIDASALKTWPQKYGIRNTKHIGLILIGALCTGLFLLNIYITKKALIIQGSIYLITLISIYFSKKSQPPYYSSFWVEALPILWWCLLLIF